MKSEWKDCLHCDLLNVWLQNPLHKGAWKPHSRTVNMGWMRVGRPLLDVSSRNDSYNKSKVSLNTHKDVCILILRCNILLLLFFSAQTTVVEPFHREDRVRFLRGVLTDTLRRSDSAAFQGAFLESRSRRSVGPACQSGAHTSTLRQTELHWVRRHWGENASRRSHE